MQELKARRCSSLWGPQRGCSIITARLPDGFAALPVCGKGLFGQPQVLLCCCTEPKGKGDLQCVEQCEVDEPGAHGRENAGVLASPTADRQAAVAAGPKLGR